MTKSKTLMLAFAATAAFLAGCASDPADQQKVTEARNCTGVAPATGTMLKKKEDCDRRAMTTEEINEFRRATVITGPLPGRSGGQ